MKLSRRGFIQKSAATALAAHPLTSLAKGAGKQMLFVGTQTGQASTSKGIYTYSFDPATGELTQIELAAEGNNPTFLAIAGTVAVVQVLIITTPGLGRIFQVEWLHVTDWLYILAGTASVLVFAEIARRIRMAIHSAARGTSEG